MAIVAAYRPKLNRASTVIDHLVSRDAVVLAECLEVEGVGIRRVVARHKRYTETSRVLSMLHNPRYHRL